MCLRVDPVLASAGDDGVVCIWVPSDSRENVFGDMPDQHAEDKESWRVKHMCRSSGSEIYDLVWSPDGIYILTGSMDNVARIYDSRDGNFLCVFIHSDIRTMYSQYWRA
jgi:chromatin assembly factor 1 subunit B